MFVKQTKNKKFEKLWLNQSAAFMVIGIFCLVRKAIFPSFPAQNYISDTSVAFHTENFHTAFIYPFQVLYPPAESAVLLCLINGSLSTLRIIKCSEAKKLKYFTHNPFMC